MSCPLCGRGKARRGCPALGHTICSACCGTKRQTEIRCPPTCVYLSVAREHPAAVTRRRQERDVAVLLPTLQALSERQQQLFFLVQQAVIARHVPDSLTPLSDDDVADAAAAMAATLETALRGVIYEHAPQTGPARRLRGELAVFIEQTGKDGGAVFQREAAAVLRAIEQGARRARQTTEGGERAYLQLMGRLVPPGPDTVEQPVSLQAEKKPGLILP